MSINNIQTGSFNNVGQGSFSNVGSGSFNNVAGGSFNNTNQQSQGNIKPGSIQEKIYNTTGINFQGSLLGNINENFKAQSAGITSLIGGIFNYDKEGRQALLNIVNAAKGDTEQQKNLADALLSTYNITLNDIGNMPLGDLTRNIVEGAWQHPVDAFFDFMSIKSFLKPKAKGKAKISPEDYKLGEKIDKTELYTQLSEKALKDNINIDKVGKEFTNSLRDIETKYTPEQISRGMQAIETVGFKQAPKDLIPVMQDLSKANDIYKQFTKMAGAEMLDDAHMATIELLTKEHNIPFEDMSKISKESKMYKEAFDYVKENDVRPLFHLKPKILVDAPDGLEKVESNLLKRRYGTQDYVEAANKLADKAEEFTRKVVNSQVLDSPNRINKVIEGINKQTGSSIPKLETRGLFKNKTWKELNSELKKVMLSSGIYLGANVVTTTLSILNNFNASGLLKTIGNLPKYHLPKIQEATTPGLKQISKLNNYIYRPIAGIDRWLEDFALEYIKNIGIDKAKFLQSAIPSKVVPTNAVQTAVRDLLPFGSYPVAAMKEVGAHLTEKPIKALALNQINKIGQEVNIGAQQLLGLNPDRTQAIRLDENGNPITRNTIVTPIQAANMFVFGEYGDAIQIPVIKWLNDRFNGVNNANYFDVDGKRLKMENGKLITPKGEMEMLPLLASIGRDLVSPVKFYNDVVVPLMSDKYIVDKTKMFNRVVNDAQYANMTTANQRRVVDNAREKLGKRLVGTYEYNYYNPDKFISKSTRRKFMRKMNQRKNLENSLRIN